MSEDFQITRKHAINKKRKAREARYLKGGCGAMVFYFFIMPLCVVALNYWFGWKVAVLGFPVLIYFSRYIMPQSKDKRSKNWIQKGTLYFSRFAVFILPIIAVVYNNQETMRLWAVVVAFAFCLNFSFDQKIRNSFIDFVNVKPDQEAFLSIFVVVTASVVFLFLSEIFWNFTNFSVWIWYHAYFMTVLILIILLLVYISYLIFGEAKPSKKSDNVIEKRNPPLEGSEGERYDVFLRKPNRVFHKYRNITFHQTKTIFSKIKWQKELDAYEGEQKEINENTKPAFIIEFGGGYQFYLEPINDIATKLKWASPKERKFFEAWVTPNQHEAFDVPLDLIPDLMRLCWIEEWDVVTNKLQPYIQTGAE